MIHFNFNQPGGYPLDTETFADMQEAYQIYTSLTSILGGDYIIVKDATTSSGRVSNGIVAVKGELMPFVGGAVQTNVIIVETKKSKTFEIGGSKVVSTTKSARFGSGSNTIAWSKFVRPKDLEQLRKTTVPVGLISMWAGAINAIPTGWKLCDGTNSTPNLSGQFIVGYDKSKTDYAMGKTGGSDKVTLSEAQMPKHTHNGTVSSSGAHTHNYRDSYHIEAIDRGPKLGSVEKLAGQYFGSLKSDSDNNYLYYVNRQSESAGNHTHDLTVDSAGNSQPVENRPSYYTLAYIQFKG